VISRQRGSGFAPSRPALLGIGYAALGFGLSVFVVRDTSDHVQLEAGKHPKVATARFGEVFTRTSFRDPNLFAVCQAGLINNLNDGMSWAIFPMFFASFGLGVERIGVLKAVYPAIWGVLQTLTGHIPGALSVPVEKLATFLRMLPHEKEIVAYCRGPFCFFSHEAVLKLKKKGFEARRLNCGLPDWRFAGLPVETGQLK